MKKYISILVFIFLCFSAKSQRNGLVQNLKWEFDGPKMIITYDLISPDGIDRTYDLRVSIDLGNDQFTPTKGVLGINKQRAGKARVIEWYFTRSGKSEEELNVDDLKVSVEAINPIPPFKDKNPQKIIKEEEDKPVVITDPVVKKPSIILPASVAGAGLGVAVLGFVTEGKAKDLYKIYEAHTVESVQREADYNAANNKHKSAQYLQIGGGVLVGVGGFLLYRTMKKRKSGDFSVVPVLDDAPLYGWSSGMGIRYSF